MAADSASGSTLTTIAGKNKNEEAKTHQSLEQLVDTDWLAKITAPPKLVVPSFIRLFVIRRILGNYIDEKAENADIESKIHDIVKALKDDKVRQFSYNILSRLWRNGLQSYMSFWYKEEEQATVIEMIFIDIILAKFGKQYEEITRYKSNSDDNDDDNDNDNDGKSGDHNINQCLVFNTNDLMYLIFQFLNFWGELYNCTLVNTHWLCQIWNSTSLSCVDLTPLIKQTMKYRLGDENMCTRMWQRIVYVKEIKFCLTEYYSKHDNDEDILLLNRLSMLVNVERIQCSLRTNSITVLKALMKKCCNKIKTFILDLSTDMDIFFSEYENTLSPLKLIHANFIDINHLYFYTTWSRMCKTLILTRINIGKSWCQHVINKCDSSGIKSLTLDSIHFQDFEFADCGDSLTTTATTTTAKEDKSTKLLLLKLAQQFKNVRDLKLMLTYMNDNTSYFLTSLCKIVSKNNESKIEINLCQDIDIDILAAMQWFTCTNNVKVDVLSIYLDHDTGKLIETIGTQMNDLKCIKIKHGISLMGLQHSGEINFDQIKTNCKFLPSLQVVLVEYDDDRHILPTASEINKFLNSKVILQWALNDILVICDLRCACNFSPDTSPIQNLYNIFADLYSLLIEHLQSVLIDIRIQFSARNWDFTQAKDKYWSYFNRKRMTKEYKAPQLNEKQKNYYQSLINPIVKFIPQVNGNFSVLDIRVANACLLCKDSNVN